MSTHSPNPLPASLPADRIYEVGEAVWVSLIERPRWVSGRVTSRLRLKVRIDNGRFALMRYCVRINGRKFYAAPCMLRPRDPGNRGADKPRGLRTPTAEDFLEEGELL